jgi:hypothetical protein
MAVITVRGKSLYNLMSFVCALVKTIRPLDFAVDKDRPS